MSYSKIAIIENCCLVNQSPLSVIRACIAKNDDLTRTAVSLTFKNEGEKNIIAAGVRINVYDSEGQRIGKTIKCWYKNINIAQGICFGENRKIPVYANAETLECEVGAIKFADGTIWQADSRITEKTKVEKPDNVTPAEDKVTPLAASEKLAATVAATAEAAAETVETVTIIEKPELTPEELERIAAEKAARKAKFKKIFKKVAIFGGAAVLAAAAVIVAVKVVIPTVRYNNAVSMMESGQYLEAADAFTKMGDYKDAASKIDECQKLKVEQDYNSAIDLMKSGKYDEAMQAFNSLGTYKDSQAKIEECQEAVRSAKYEAAEKLLKDGKYEEAEAAFGELGSYKESADKITECKYQIALKSLEAKEYQTASELFDEIGDYKDSKEQSKEAFYQYAMLLYKEEKFDESNELFSKLDGYKDSADKIHIHEYTDEVTLEPTCTETGIRTYTCECGKQYTEPIDALGHSFDSVKVTKEATCTQKGSKTLTCHCGESKVEEIPATGHSYTPAVTLEPSCEIAGIMTFTCHCGDSYTEGIPPKGHDFAEATCKKAKKCRVCGKEEGHALGHTTTRGKCGRCHLYIRDGEEWEDYDEWYEYNSDDEEEYYDEDW